MGGQNGEGLGIGIGSRYFVMDGFSRGEEKDEEKLSGEIYIPHFAIRHARLTGVQTNVTKRDVMLMKLFY